MGRRQVNRFERPEATADTRGNMADRDIRLHLEGGLAAGSALTLDAGPAHYLAKVMRCATGDRVRVFNERDGEWWATLGIGKRQVALAVETQYRPPIPETGPLLAMALVKRQAFELVVEKATELGVSAIQPLITERSQADRLRQERLIAIAVEAAEQCERLSVPNMNRPVALDRWLQERSKDRILLAAIERSGAAGVPTLPSESAAAVDLVIGPEGGFSLSEVQLLAAAGTPVSLGPRILRAETAAIAGLALLGAHSGAGED